MKIDILSIENKLKKILTVARFRHSLNTRDVAVKLALKYGVDVNKALVAGLLHDCAKESKEQIKLDKASVVLHAFTGRKLAQEYFGIDDLEILQAIESHVMGNENMSLLDKIVFVSDFIEKDRNFKGLDEIRILAEQDLDAVFKVVLMQKIKYLLDYNKVICEDIIKTWNALIVKNL
ncbi:MAG: HD domain-containing protein [bacterium]|nr:HD domain-containing protein [bacterium]